MDYFVYRTLLTFSQKEVLLWHLQKESLARSFPQSENASISAKPSKGRHKTIWELSIRQWFFQHKWEFEFIPKIENSSFYLNMLKGPFRNFSLKIIVRTVSVNSCELIEELKCTMRWPLFFPKWRKKIFQKRMKRFFEYKHEMLNHDLLMLSKYHSHQPLKVLIAGASGFIGSSLVSFLKCAGHYVKTLSRQEKKRHQDQLFWNPETGKVNLDDLEGFDVIINLAGFSIGKKRWSSQVKECIAQSRIDTTERLVKWLASLKSPPNTLLCASSIAYYGDHVSEKVDEATAPLGASFISETCRKWEEASKRIAIFGTRVVNLRFGLVLSSKKGSMKKLLRLFKMGFGSILGSGTQYTSWIAIDDAIAAIYHCMMTQKIEGGVNVVAPQSIPNEQFSYQLSAHLNRSLGPKISPNIVTLLYGQMGEELLLTSVRAVPSKLEQSGFIFRYPSIQQTLRHIV